jgi:K+-sensing histidine kinase KdpD
MVIFTNISEKKQAKILKEIDGYKDDILSTVSHDLKTPLNGILTMLSSAAKSNDFNDL